MPNDSARLLAGWDPYNQNTHAEFLDPEWMFSLDPKDFSGFDIVIDSVLHMHETDPSFRIGSHTLSLHSRHSSLGLTRLVERDFGLRENPGATRALRIRLAHFVRRFVKFVHLTVAPISFESFLAAQATANRIPANFPMLPPTRSDDPSEVEATTVEYEGPGALLPLGDREFRRRYPQTGYAIWAAAFASREQSSRATT
jgi:hypothetical protein